MGQPEVLLADAGYFSAANITACEAAELTPLIAVFGISKLSPRLKSAPRPITPSSRGPICWPPLMPIRKCPVPPVGPAYTIIAAESTSGAAH